MPPDRETFDVVVIGYSLTGALTSLALAERGLRVALLRSLFDGAGLERIIEVPPTPLNDAAISGADFQDRWHARAEAAGVFDAQSYVNRIGDDLAAVDIDDHATIGRKIVYAPVGHEPLVRSGPFYELLGLAVSMCAWSDAPFVARRNATAVVVGCGLRAAEEALQCVRAGVRDVLVVCEGEPKFGALESRVRAAPIRIKSNARLGDLHMDATGRSLAAIARPADDYAAMIADVPRVVTAVCG